MLGYCVIGLLGAIGLHGYLDIGRILVEIGMILGYLIIGTLCYGSVELLGYWATWLLGYWEDVGRILGGYWEDIGRTLGGYLEDIRI